MDNRAQKNTYEAVLVAIERVTGTTPDSDELNLFEAGLIDSFGMLELIMEIETIIGKSLNEEDLTVGSFSTVAEIVRLVESQARK